MSRPPYETEFLYSHLELKGARKRAWRMGFMCGVLAGCALVWIGWSLEDMADYISRPSLPSASLCAKYEGGCDYGPVGPEHNKR